MNTRKHILITGSNRSGSTWVGRVLSAHDQVDNIIEPLNLNRMQRFGRVSFDYWYPKLPSGDEMVESEVRKLVAYYLSANKTTFFIRIFSRYEGHGWLASIKKQWRRARKPIKMLKDPTALFCVPFLNQEFDVAPVILIRHPAAYVLSIKDQDWWFDFNNLLEQPHFFEDGLEHLKAELVEFKSKESERSIIENAALLWKVFYTQVALYKKRYPEWFFITHETLSLNPYAAFEKMFAYLGLEFSVAVQRHITESTQSSDLGEFKRDSVKNTTKWRHQLTETEKSTIFEITSGVSDMFYDSWG